MFRPPLNGYNRSHFIDDYASNSERITILSKKTEKKKGSLLKTASKDFLNNTSLNGLNFVGSDRITLYER